MKSILLLSVLLTLTATAAKKNVLLICIDDLRPELKSFGAEYIHSPNIDLLAENGRAFHRHYVNAPSCGPSRFTLLTGRYGSAGNNALFLRAKDLKSKPGAIPPSMPEWFRQNGYTTVSVGKVSHHPGGRGGSDWDDDSIIEIPNAWDAHLMPCGDWRHPRGAMHGLANGEIRKNAKDMDIFQSMEGADIIYPDGLLTREGIKQLKQLAEMDQPFFLAIGLIRPHLPFGAPAEYMKPYEGMTLPPIPHPSKPAGKTTWHTSGEFMKYNRWGKDPNKDAAFAEEVRLHYAACVTYADKQVGDIMAALSQSGADKDTIVIVWGDHGWHLGEHAIWGKHALFEESLHSPLIISYPSIDNPGISSDAVVGTVDIFPTLCDLTGLESPDFTHGQSLLPLIGKPDAPGHGAVGYKGNAQTLRTDTHRIIVHKDGFVELYDHTSPEKETVNVAGSNQQLVSQLKEKLAAMKK